MTTEQNLREALKTAFMEGYTSRATYNDIELSSVEQEWAKAQSSLMTLAQPPAPEQQAPQGIKLTHVFTSDVDAEQRKLCEKYRDLVQGVEKQDELKNALWSLDFYKARCDLLQKWQSKMRDPERTIVCDILANGQTMPDPTGARYGLPATPEQQAPQPDPLERVTRLSEDMGLYPWQQAPQGWKLVPVEPTPEHIDSIAMRYRHDFGILPEDQRENLRRFARQMYEECTGQGFHQMDHVSASTAHPLAAQKPPCKTKEASCQNVLKDT